MKKGFALLETLIVITFLCVSLLLLYGTFSGMLSNSKKNVYYDNASNIYKAYYLKEYLNLYNLKDQINNEDIKEFTCEAFVTDGCDVLVNEFNINKMYLAKTDLKEYNKDNYSSMFNEYLNTLSNNTHSSHRLIIEINDNSTYSYASIGLDYNE